MGWFLSRDSGPKKKKKRSSSKKSAQAAGWDPQRTLLGLKMLGGAATAVLVVIGWNAGENALTRYAASARGGAVNPNHVELAGAPSWMDPKLHQQLQAQVADAVMDDPMNRRGLALSVELLQENPWVENVTQVRRLGDGHVKVEATYRAPAAVIAGRHGYHVVDRSGVLLEQNIDRAATRFGLLPLVTGVSAAPPAAAGDTWDGTDINAALTLEETLRREPYADQITAFDVSHRDLNGRLWLVLYTNGPAVVWGLAPGEERSVEPQAPVKIGALRDWAYTHQGRIDQGAQVVWVYTGTAQTDARPHTVSASRR
ncbi:MAG: hypothetical protein V3V20_08395 [Algisphaera sp.]